MNFYVNGIDGSTGKYLLPPFDIKHLAELAKSWLRDRSAFARTPTRGEPVYGVDPKRLASSGWGVLFASDANGKTREALSQLLEHRRRQATARHPSYYREYCGAQGYRRGESARQWLTRQGAGPGAADPEHVPYYLLLVGDPEEIPFEFQCDLSVQYAVGRVSFDSPREYINYGRHVIQTENNKPNRCRRVVLWGASNPDDLATESCVRSLMQPLEKRLRRDIPGLQIDTILGSSATKARLAKLMGGSETPALLLTGSHGMSFGTKEPRDRTRLGALLCQDWPGPKTWKEPIPPRFYFAAKDVGELADLSGLIAFHFACFSAGVPRLDSYARTGTGEPQELAPKPMLAHLPKRMLGKPIGGALAVIGHVDRAYGYSFIWPGAGAQPQIFASTLARLLNGHPVGSAMRYMSDRYSDLSANLHHALARYREHDPESVEELAKSWTAYVDARSYIVIGDPAVRLATREQ